jgi:spermidine dehydrogenase
MPSKITRRDFIDGVACSVVAGIAYPNLVHGASTGVDPAGAYPPALTGFRGSREPDYAAAHALRDGAKYRIDDYPVSEEFDRVVVGAGIGGLASAYFVRKARPSSGMLILDNHDDFGGHARRNEFNVDGRLLIGYGGSESIQSPKSGWSRTALGLLADLGVRIDRFEKAIDTNLYPSLGLSSGLMFERETFGVDKLVTGDPQRNLPSDIPERLHHGRPIAEFAADCPLSPDERLKLIDLYTARRDVLSGASARDRLAMLESISYAEFLRKYWDLDATTLKLFLGRTLDLFALTAEFVPAAEAASCALPGFQGLDIAAEDDISNTEPYIYHFPDGNASIARLLVRRLCPHAASGSTMEDIVTARFNYDELDRPGAPVRLRLSSTVVQLRNRGAGVDLLYVKAGEAHRVRCRHLIYSGYDAMLPYVCAEIPPLQRESLASCIRAPLVYVNVAVRNWRPWVARGVHYIFNPTGFYSVMKLDYPVSLGQYRCAHDPNEPIVLHLVHIPQPPHPLPDRRATLRAARQVLYGRPFSDFETALRDQLGRALGAGGFDAERDISAITVNRWGHGYAYDLDKLSDPTRNEEFAAASRARLGRISVAGSDAAWTAYAHAAIDAAYRASREVLG